MNHDIQIEVKTRYLADQSEPFAHRYAFAYTITITNRGAEPARLIARRWLIVDANDQQQEVQGLGVVGEQPRLEAGESYTYTSGAVLETTTGTMSGHYQMRTDNNELFDAPIPTFLLAKPDALH